MKSLNHMTFAVRTCIVTFLIAFGCTTLMAKQASESRHPTIWVNNDDKARILDNISKYTWASSLFNTLKANVDAKKNTHKTNPSTLLSTIPTRGATTKTHVALLTLGVEAGILYYLTDDEDYAQLAADILSDYTVEMGTAKNGDIAYKDDEFMDSRATWPRLALIYDFVHPFLIKSGTTVYDNVSKTRKVYDLELARTTFKILADLVFSEGGLRSNHSVLEGQGALLPILCLEDETERNTYKTKFWNGAPKQDAFTWSLNNFTKEGMWPETVTYGKGPQDLMMQMMEVLDRNWPDYKVFDNYMRILDGAFVYENFKYPNKISIMAYGDSRRQSIGTEDLYRTLLAISNRKGFDSHSTKAYPILKAMYDSKGGYNPSLPVQSLSYDAPLQLLWGSPIPESTQSTKIKMNTIATVTHAGLVMQRNYFTTNESLYGLMCYTGGAHYVHSHLSGLDMELYGAGYVMGGVGADMPSVDDRGLDINRHYYRIYAGHNTVIVNGNSKGQGASAWKPDGILWQNTTVVQSVEPKPLEDPISESFSFSSQFLGDKVNNCDQQRIMSVVRTSPTTGYYIDFFRSKSLGTNNFHDYVYHNIGDKIELFDENNAALSLTAQTSRYTSTDVTYNGAIVKFPGWHYFQNVNTSSKVSGMVKAKISLTSKNRYMHVLMPNGVEREYSTTTAPPILEAEGGYDKIDARVLTLRQTGEAWNRPFVAVYEPSSNAASTVVSVENLMDGTVIVGAKVISKVGTSTITDFIIAQNNSTAVYELTTENLRFEGRFGIVRKIETPEKTTINLYIGDGTRLEYKNQVVEGGIAKKAFRSYDLDPTSVASVSKSNIKLRLNSESSQLTIQVPDSKASSYKIFDLNGTLMQQDKFSNTKTVDLSHLNSGLYIVQVASSDELICRKVNLK